MRAIALSLLLATLASPVCADPWALPVEGDCTPKSAQAGSEVPDHPFKPGDVISHEQAGLLRDYVPAELWEHRERFFFDGMQLEIGPCHRDYSAPDFFRDATETFRGQARLDANGQLVDHTAGLPFPPDTIALDDPRVGLKWAWNWVNRYSGAGRYGDVRLTFVDAQAKEARFEGDFFWIRLAGRADRSADGYRVPIEHQAAWVAGGETRNLDGGETCSWRQYANAGRRPDLFFWSPARRRVVRGNAPDAEGPLSGCITGGYSSLLLHGMSPQLHDWQLVAVRDVLAPINSRTPSYPEDAARSFGPYGISFANDRWELRRVIVLEGTLRAGRFDDGVKRFRWYIDLQTLSPLYYASYRVDGNPAGAGYFVGRWSEDRLDYRPWPDDASRPVRVIDGVGAALVEWNQRDAVRLESFSTVSTPPVDKKVKRLVSQASLRGR